MLDILGQAQTSPALLLHKKHTGMAYANVMAQQVSFKAA